MQNYNQPYSAAQPQSKNHRIEFLHLATGMSVYFPCFVTDYSESFASNWNAQNVYGRMDPIATFQGTVRTISLSWVAVAFDEQDGVENLRKTNNLAQMSYPVYDSRGVMGSPPILRLKMMNLITKAPQLPNSPNSSTSTSSIPLSSNNSSSNTSVESGLVGYTDGINFNFDLEAGVFDSIPNQIIPKVINFSCTFHVLHEHLPGFNKQGQYGVDRSNESPLQYPFAIVPIQDQNQPQGIAAGSTAPGGSAEGGAPADTAPASPQGTQNAPTSNPPSANVRREGTDGSSTPESVVQDRAYADGNPQEAAPRQNAADAKVVNGGRGRAGQANRSAINPAIATTSGRKLPNVND
jgi:hypothetical protein